MSETPHPETNQRQLLLTLGLSAVLVLALGIGFVAGFLTGRGQGNAGERAGAPVHDHAAHAPIAAAAGAVDPAAAFSPAAAGAAQANADHVAGGTKGAGGKCVYELPVKDQWILAGLTCICDESHCNRTPLPDCHCDTAHEMKTLAKQLIVEGMGAEGIGAELEKRWGPGVLPARGAAR